MNLNLERFSSVSLADPFFESLKADYAEFGDWFARKSSNEAYVFRGADGAVEGFLYLKIEDGAVEDVHPKLPPARRLKVGTLKINPHGTRLGERFVKKLFDHAISEGVREAYVTVFPKHEALISLLGRYGFVQCAEKVTRNGTELVLKKNMTDLSGDVARRYPLIKLGDNRAYLLSINPPWHTRLLPDSILAREDASIVQDVSHSNSIHKVYLAGMRGMEVLRPGDVLLIYRTSDGKGPAHYRSVATSLCVVEEHRLIDSFRTRDEFIAYCRPYSVFNEDELEDLWRTKRYPHLVRFTYNFALPRRVTRASLIETHGFDKDAYFGFMPIPAERLRSVLEEANFDASLIVD